MLASHNSMTYCNPKCFIFKAFKWLWKCQNLSILGQINAGVSYFDIRIRINNGNITFCHGLVDLYSNYNLYTLLKLLEQSKVKCRIIMEKGDLNEFNEVAFPVFEPFLKTVVLEVRTKKNWQLLYGNDIYGADHFYIPFYSGVSFLDNLKNLSLSTPKKYAKANNPKSFKDFINSESIHFFDFI